MKSSCLVFSNAASNVGVKVSSRTGSGDVVETILKIASEEQTDLILMGASGGSLVENWLSANVMGKGNIPVSRSEPTSTASPNSKSTRRHSRRLQYSSASHHLLVTEEIMAKVDQAAPKKDEPVAVPNHTEKIKSQVLEKVGRPPRLHRVEVCRHHDGNYRVNIWEQLEPMGDFALSMGVHIRSSYYLKVSDTGEIIRSNPPLTKLGFSA